MVVCTAVAYTAVACTAVAYTAIAVAVTAVAVAVTAVAGTAVAVAVAGTAAAVMKFALFMLYRPGVHLLFLTDPVLKMHFLNQNSLANILKD